MHGPTPEALAAYQKVRLPLSGEVQEASVQVSSWGPCSSVAAREPCSACTLHDPVSRESRGTCQEPGHPTASVTHDLGHPTTPAPTAPQLFKDFQSGNATKNEIEINTERGFTSRTFEPLVAAPAVVPAA